MKISHFTDFLPDETVYSVACRYFDRMQFRSYSIVSQHLFGGQTNGVVTDLPSSLEHLIQALPPYHRYTADIIIDQHTLFPLYAPFLSFERSSILRHRMKAGSPAVHWIAGITTSRVSRVQWLRYCPACVDYDRLTYGECYWHRVHQVPGVLVCPIHEIMLEDSSVNMAHGYNVAQFCSAECSVNTLPQHRVPAHLCAILVQIARNAKWLLEQPVSIDQGYVRQLYLSLLAERGLVATRGRVRYAKLKKVALDYYPADLLEKLECGIQSKENWLANWTVIRHPLHHLLFIQLLCETTQEFFTKPHPTSAPFGNGPWPCLNPLCSHFQERVITSYTLRHSPLNRPIATFACLCGFKYSRSGPDIDDEASFRIGAISQYGDVWDQQLTTYWLDPKIPTSQIACLMHVSTKTVQRQAARLGLPFAPDIPRRGKRPKIHQDSINEQRDTYRALWEETRKSLSDAEVKKTVKAPSQAYYWLWEHDREWLKEHYTSGGLSLRNEQLLQSRIQMLRNHYSQVDADLAKAVMELLKRFVLAQISRSE